MNFQLPQPDDFDYYGNSSQDESRGSQGRQFSGFLDFQLSLAYSKSFPVYAICFANPACRLHMLYTYNM